MRTLHTNTYLLVSVLAGVILLAACAGFPQYEQIAQSEGLTLEEKIQELVSHGASRTEVLATLGPSTGYTHDTFSYTVYNGYNSTNPPMKMSYPLNSMNYPDPGHHGNYRWVLSFDDRGSLYKYRRIPIREDEKNRVYEYMKDEIARERHSWYQAYRAGFTALECTNTEHCWAVGGAGLVLETIDGGKSWASHDSGIDRYRRLPVIPSIYSASFPDPVNGWLTGHDSSFGVGGIILHSQDGGKNWSFQIKSDSVLRPQHALWSITFNDNRQGWAVGGRGTILHTTDGGSTWAAQSGGTNAALLSVGFCDGKSGWAVGSSRTILHTSDAGQNWHAQAIDADQLPSKTPEGKLFVYPSTLSIFPYEDPLTSLSVIDCRQGWIAGDRGIILHTEDGGATWLAQLSGTTESLNAVQFISAHQGWAVGNGGVILRTIDGGKEWKSQSSGTREDLRDLSFVDAEHGWIGGSYGTILHTSDGGATWTNQCFVYDCAGKAAQKFYWHPWLK